MGSPGPSELEEGRAGGMFLYCSSAYSMVSMDALASPAACGAALSKLDLLQAGHLPGLLT